MSRVSDPRLRTCGWCREFEEHKHPQTLPGGWWVGEGRCKIPEKSGRKYTVSGDTCRHHNFSLLKREKK
jgi:hypothetical protein